MLKKKPMVTCAHTDDTTRSEHWVTAVAAYPNTDLVASGTFINMPHLYRCMCSVRRQLCKMLFILSNQVDNLMMYLFFCTTGSNNGEIRLWKCGEGFRSLEPCFSIPLVSE